jgi:hypothetical protein
VPVFLSGEAVLIGLFPLNEARYELNRIGRLLPLMLADCVPL